MGMALTYTCIYSSKKTHAYTLYPYKKGHSFGDPTSLQEINMTNPWISFAINTGEGTMFWLNPWLGECYYYLRSNTFYGLLIKDLVWMG